MSKDIFDKLVDPKKGIRLLFTIETDLNNCGENWPTQDDEVWEKVKAAKDDKEKDLILDNWLENWPFVRPVIDVMALQIFLIWVLKNIMILNARIIEIYCF